VDGAVGRNVGTNCTVSGAHLDLSVLDHVDSPQLLQLLSTLACQMVRHLMGCLVHMVVCSADCQHVPVCLRVMRCSCLSTAWCRWAAGVSHVWKGARG
jgi:hypothetical protein